MVKCLRLPMVLAIGFVLMAVSAVPLSFAYGQDEDFGGAAFLEGSQTSEAEFDVASGEAASSWRFSDGYHVGSHQQGSQNGIALYADSNNTWWKSDGVYYGSNGVTVWGAKGFGVDVSTHQGPINWARVKDSGVTFAIIRCGYGSDYTGQDDNQFIANVRGCRNNGIPFGIYLYSYAKTTDMASSEAAHVLRLMNEAGLSPLDLSYPIYYDLEEGGSSPNISNDQLLANTKVFCAAISAAGFVPGVYANTNWWTHYLTSAEYDQWPRWVAQYNYRCTYGKHYDIWQADSQSSISGITDGVDVNFDYTGPIIHGDQWVYSNGSWWYHYQDGSYPANGWALIDGKWYYFDASGWMQTGWVCVGGIWYYLSDSGAMVDGWQYINGAWYFLSSDDGAMVQGWYKSGETWYYLDSSRGGAMATGWVRSGSSWYWMNGSGAMQTGWAYVGSAWYYLTPDNGDMVVGKMQVGEATYHFDSSGAMTTGWAFDSGSWYWSDDSGALKSGWLNAGGAWYWLSESSFQMAAGWQLVDNSWYYLDSSRGGAMSTGWVSLGSTWYYLEPSGAMVTGWANVQGTWYWLAESGAMLTGWQLIDDLWYCFDESGAMVSSRWIGNYYVRADGSMATSQWVGGYYVDSDGLWDPNANLDSIDAE